MRSTLDHEARTVDAVLATEQPVFVFDVRSWSIIREILMIDGGKCPDQVPLLDSHERSTIKAQLGSTRMFRREDGMLVATREFSKVREADNAFTLVREGHLTDGSIGYRVLEYADLQPKESTTIRGRTFKNDTNLTLRISYAWHLIEDSVTAVGADSLAKMRV